jgi:hypothetical protein
MVKKNLFQIIFSLNLNKKTQPTYVTYHSFEPTGDRAKELLLRAFCVQQGVLSLFQEQTRSRMGYLRAMLGV